MFQSRQWNLLIALSISALAVGGIIQHRMNSLLGFPTTPANLAYEAGLFLGGALLIGVVAMLIATGWGLLRGKSPPQLAALNLGVLLFIVSMASLHLALETSGIEFIRAGQAIPRQENR